MAKQIKINNCENCNGQGVVFSGINWSHCPECQAVSDKVFPKDCQDGNHNHCEDIEFEGKTLVVCHDCQRTLGRKTEVYSRVVGYLRPVSGWNKGKKAEFEERKTYCIKKDTSVTSKRHD